MALGPVTLTVTPRTHDVVIEVECEGMTLCTVYRQDVGGSVAVRGLNETDDITPGTPDRVVGVDPEVSNGHHGYVAVVSDGTIFDTSEEIVVNVDHGGDWLMPLGIATRGRVVNVESLRTHTYAADREVVAVLGRRDPIAVQFGRHWFSGQLVLLTLEADERDWLREILYGSRIIVFCPRLNAGYPLPLYLSVGEVTEERTSGYALEQSRRWTLEVQSVAAPPADYIVEPAGTTWGAVEGSGDTWVEVKIAHTWKSLMGLD